MKSKIYILIFLSFIFSGCVVSLGENKQEDKVETLQEKSIAKVPKLKTPVNKLENFSFEDSAENSGKASNWVPYSKGYERVQKENGSWWIMLENKGKSSQRGARQEIILSQNYEKPVFIGGYVWGENIENSENGYFGASLYLEIHLVDGAIVYENSIANYGSFSKRWIGINTGTLGEVTGPIDKIYIMPSLINASGRAYFDDLVVQEYIPGIGAVTLMFDDGKMSTWNDARPVLDENGLPGVVAAISGKVGKPGFMDWEQLHQLEDNGWEITSHSVNHFDLVELSPERAEIEISESKKQLELQGLEISSLAYPFGAFNGDINAIASRYYDSSRNYSNSNNPAGNFPYDINIRSIYSNTTAEDVRDWLEQADSKGEWTILVFHIIANEGKDNYHISAQVFSDIVNKVKESNLPILTYTQGIRMFTVRDVD